MAGSKWRGQVDAMWRQLPRSAGRQIEGILTRYVDPAVAWLMIVARDTRTPWIVVLSSLIRRFLQMNCRSHG